MKSKTLAIIGISVLTLTACSAPSGGASGGAASDKPFTVLFLAGVTGAQASSALEEKRSLLAAVSQINGEGGILGRKVVVESYDTKSDPTEAVTVLQKRLSNGEPKPDLVRAGLSSAETLALEPILTREKISSWTDAGNPAAGDSKAYPYLKLIAGSATAVAVMGKQYVLDQKVKNLALFASQDATGDGQVAALNELYKGTSVKVNVFRYSTSDLDLSIAYQRVISSKPDMIYADSASVPLSTRIVEARGKVAGATDIPVLGGGGTAGSISVVAAQVPASYLKDFRIIVYSGALAQPKAAQTDTFKYWYKKVHPVLGGQIAASLAFDGMRMYAAAMNDAKSTDADKVRESIIEKKWPSGFFITYGDTTVHWTSASNFPVADKSNYEIIQAGPAVNDVGQFAKK
ncbi:MAG: hypothetical protein JWO10_1104 [Microbacteriaceae bacterium]|nr:hypothetical protein [Microbacteriaceae bacterium]